MYRCLLMISLLVAFSPLVRGQANVITDWNTPATLSYDFCEVPRCDRHPVITTFITFDPNIHRQMIVPGVKVRFGPFHVKKTGGPSRVGFSVSILARSPATYFNGRFTGASQDFREIGRGGLSTVSTEDFDPPQQDFFVTATLPSVFNAIKIEANISVATRTATFPAACANLTATGGTADLDNECLQGAVNPTGVLVPKVLPVAIIYEPPGNCSFATLTQLHTVGSTLTVQTAEADVSRSLNDPGLLATTFGSQISDITEKKLSQNTRRSSFTITSSDTFPTALGPSGNPACANPDATTPPRNHSGPGEGDLFILLVNPALVYWNSFGMSNFVLAPPGKLNGLPFTRLVQVTAADLATQEGRDGLRSRGLDLTEAEALAIRKLDGLTARPCPNCAASSIRRPRLGPRYVDLGEPIISLGPRQSHQGDVTFAQTLTANDQACNETSSTTSESEDPELVVRLTGLATQFDIGGAFGASDDKVLPKLADKILDFSLSKIFGNRTTTTTTTYSTCRSLDSVAGDSLTQVYFAQDTNTNVAFTPFYDSFFGTIAFNPVEAGTGTVLNALVRRLNLPNLSWQVTTNQRKTWRRSPPTDVMERLKQLNIARLEVAPARDYVVPLKFSKGLASGTRIEARTGTLIGSHSSLPSGKTIALFYGIDSQGARVAQIWIQMRPPP